MKHPSHCWHPPGKPRCGRAAPKTSAPWCCGCGLVFINNDASQRAAQAWCPAAHAGLVRGGSEAAHAASDLLDTFAQAVACTEGTEHDDTPE